MPKLCSGFYARLPCFFSPTKIGKAAWTNSGDKCLFCDDAKMSKACNTIKGRGSVTRSLKAFRAHYEEHNYVYNAAMMRVPDEWREKFHEEALKSKRGQPRQPRQHRSAPAAAQGEKVGELWTAVLQHRKRAFKNLGSTEVTAYKKRRTADRKRVAKKFFVNNQLPVPEATDIATNDAGLLAAEATPVHLHSKMNLCSIPKGKNRASCVAQITRNFCSWSLYASDPRSWPGELLG